MRRRHLLLGLGAWAAAHHAHAEASITVLAAWRERTGDRVGLLRDDGGALVESASLALPTRAHGLMAGADGSALIAARRPGDWLLRWHPGSSRVQWHWMDDDRRLNGHLARCALTGAVLSTETDLDSGAGLLGVRDPVTLNKQAEWPTHGLDPHQVLVLPFSVGPWPAGTVLVANGGIPTQAETGRSKRELGRMDASLVALESRSGRLLGQWRLPDPRLSIRHLACNLGANHRSCRVGVALQAEHDDAGARRMAPVLALWDGHRLGLCRGQPELAGYAGDITATESGGFVLSCPRANTLAVFTARGDFVSALPAADACALASSPRGWLAAGRDGWMRERGATNGLHPYRPVDSAGQPIATQWDNHASSWPRRRA